VTLYATPESYDLLAGTCIPEVMVQCVETYRDVLAEKNDVLALGPGLGREHDADLREIIIRSTVPCVVDADALNALSMEISILSRCAGHRLLTPHPGEMERLNPQVARTRREWATGFVNEYPVTLLLKGARTIITQGDHPPVFNSTGNPGMGTGGMGDVLTGVCGALIGGGHSPRNSAVLGAWLCGRAAEIAIFNGSDSQESLSATSVITHLGEACTSLRNGDY
jgi:NAD(P)H-hydrate epimerase